MAKLKATYHVTPSEKGWIVKKEGAQRASSVHTTKAEAVKISRALARTKPNGTLVIHGKDGTIQSKDTYGNLIARTGKGSVLQSLNTKVNARYGGNRLKKVVRGVHVIRKGDTWQLITPQVESDLKVYHSKDAAVLNAREIARKQNRSIYIHSSPGKIVEAEMAEQPDIKQDKAEQ